MRRSFLVLGFVVAACVSQPAEVTRSTLASADAATSLAVGELITVEQTSYEGGDGQDPVINLTLRHADGRSLAFQAANHAPYDVFVQSAGGALAQVMGLQGGDEVTTLYYSTERERSQDAGAPFFCGPQGPAAIGKYEAPDGVTQIVGLRERIQVELRPDGQMEAVPYSPDAVCARLRFRRG
ncbi:MAG: hypothetical protein R3C30_04765 [Hyphomonadaceae bacterium]